MSKQRTLTLKNGAVITGTKEQIDQVVKEGNLGDRIYYSETKKTWLPVSAMADAHLKNAIIQKVITYLNNLRNEKDYKFFWYQFPEFMNIDIPEVDEFFDLLVEAQIRWNVSSEDLCDCEKFRESGGLKMFFENKNPQIGDLRVWHIPQVPGKPFYVNVSSLYEGKKVMDILGEYDKFQFENNIKPDYSNVNGLEIYTDLDSELTWLDYYDDNGNDIDELTYEELTVVQ